jgi:prepilin-type N-terminal cleavage/methylation domain-containing protein
MRHRKGFTLVEILVVIGIVALLVGILLPVISRARESSKRTTCMSNLRAIGQALTAYANEHKGQFPRVKWNPTGPVVDLPPTSDVPPDAPDPFTHAGSNDVTAAFFLLLRTQDLAPQVMVCPSTNDQADEFGGGGATARTRSDFSSTAPPYPSGRTYSYSYANPYPKETGGVGNEPLAAVFKLNNKVLKPDFAIAADFNPGDGGPSGDPDDVMQTDPKAPSARIRQGNSRNHKKKGQNVLYADGRVAWTETLFCGVLQDNIFASESVNPDFGPDHADDSVLLPRD